MERRLTVKQAGDQSLADVMPTKLELEEHLSKQALT